MDVEINPIQRFDSIIQYNYLADVQKINFSDTSAASKSIDSWIKAITDNHISSRVSEQLHGSNNVILITVLDFVGRWQMPFKRVFTAPFKCSGGKLCNSTLMERVGSYYFHWSKHLKSKIVRVLFASRYSMYVILPDINQLLPDVVELLDSRTLNNEIGLMEEKVVHVVLPKLRFDKLLNLDEAVKKVRRLQIFLLFS